MGAPWETELLAKADKAKESAANMDKAPWDNSEKIAKSGLTQHAKDLHIIEEMHPDLTLKDRAIIENFGEDEEKIKNYLHERYPSVPLGFVNDRLVMQKDGFNYPIIPKFNLMRDISSPAREGAADVLGLGVPTVKAIGSTLAGAGGALAGGGPLSPMTSIPAAMAASGASAAGLEALRQKIGQQLGVAGDLNKERILLEGGINAALPGVLGAGKTPGVAQGLYNFGTKKVLPKVGSLGSGLETSTIKRGAKYLPEIKQIEQNGVQEFANQAHADITNGLQTAKQKIGQEMNNKMTAAGAQVDIAPVREKFQNLLDKLKTEAKNGRNTPEMQAKITEVQDLMDHYLSEVPEQASKLLDEAGNPIITPAKPIEKLSPSSAFSLKQTLADLGDLENVGYYGGKSNLSEMSPAQREIAMVARDAKSALDKQITTAVDQSSAALGENPATYTSLKSQYRKLSQLQDEIEPHFRTPEKTFNTLRNSSSKNKQYLMETLSNVDKDYGTNSLKNAEVLDAYNAFGGAPSMSPISAGGVTSTSRSIPASVAGGMIGGTAAHSLGLNPYVGTAIGMYGGKLAMSPAAIRNYLEVGAVARKVGEKAAPLVRGGASLGLKQYAPTTYDLDQMEVINKLKQQQSPWTLFQNQPDPNNPQGAQ